MKNTLLLLTLCSSSIFAGGVLTKSSQPEEEIKLTQTQFETCKDNLPPSLQGFVNDFATWSKEDQNKITIHGLSFGVAGLNEEKHAPYEKNIGYWIDCRTNTQKQRAYLIACLQYLQEQKK